MGAAGSSSSSHFDGTRRLAAGAGPVTSYRLGSTPDHGPRRERSIGDEDRPQLSLTVPRLRNLNRGFAVNRRSTLLPEEISSNLKGDPKVCQRQLVNEVFGPLVTQFALNLGREAATPLQHALYSGLLGHSALSFTHDGIEALREIIKDQIDRAG
jgi:hypothetical protein